MDDASRVRGGQAVGNLGRDLERLRKGKPAAVEQLSQVDAFEELHRQVGPPAVLADVVDRDDVRMVERGRRPRLRAKAGDATGVANHHVRKDLEGDVAAEPRISCAPNLPHAAGTQCRDHFVGTNFRALANRHEMSADYDEIPSLGCGESEQPSES